MQLWQNVLNNVAKETGISWATNAIFGLYELFSCIVAEVSGYSSATISWPIIPLIFYLDYSLVSIIFVNFAMRIVE